MLINRAFLKKWNACYTEDKITALCTEAMTPAQVIADERITLDHRLWVICRVLITYSKSALVEFANHCKYEAKKSADLAKQNKYAAAAYAATAAAYAAYADAADADAAAAAYAATAAYAAAYAAYAAYADAARNKSKRDNLAFALTLLPENGTV